MPNRADYASHWWKTEAVYRGPRWLRNVGIAHAVGWDREEYDIAYDYAGWLDRLQLAEMFK